MFNEMYNVQTVQSTSLSSHPRESNEREKSAAERDTRENENRTKSETKESGRRRLNKHVDKIYFLFYLQTKLLSREKRSPGVRCP